MHDGVGAVAARSSSVAGSRIVPSTSSTSTPSRLSAVAGREVVEHDHVVTAVGQSAAQRLRADEPGSAGHDTSRPAWIRDAVPSPRCDRLFLSPPDVGDAERELLLDAFDSNWIAPLGPHVDAFEREFAEMRGRGRRQPRCRAAPPRSTSRSCCSASGPATRCWCPRSPSWPPPTRSATSAPARCSSTATPPRGTSTPELVEDELDERADAGHAPGRGDRRRPLRAVRRLRADPRRRARATGCPIVEDAAEALGATYRGSAGGHVRRHRRVLVQRQQDHHHQRRRHARRPTTRR